MEVDTIFNSPDFITLQELEQRRAAIAGQLDAGQFATPQNEVAYRAAHSQLETQIIEIAHRPEVQNSLAAEGDRSLQAIEELKPLEGILPDEELSALKQEYIETIARISAHFDTYGAATPEAILFAEKVAAVAGLVAAEADVVPVEPEAAEQDLSGEKAKKEVTITIGQNLVRVGKSGITVKYSYKSEKRQDQMDYTVPRRNALIKMLSLGEGEIIKARDLFAVAFGPEEEFDRNKLFNIRDWFGKLTYYGVPLIKYTRNGNYFVDPQYSLGLKFGGKLQAEIEELERAVEDDEAEAPSPAQPEIEMPDGLDRGDLFITASQLVRVNFVLKDAGIGEIDEDMIKSLQAYAPDLSRFNGYDAAKSEYKRLATERVINILSDREAFFNYVDGLDPESVEHKFLEFLYTLNEEQQKLVTRLINSKIEMTKIVRGSVVSVPPSVYDQFGALIYPFLQPEKLHTPPAPIAPASQPIEDVEPVQREIDFIAEDEEVESGADDTPEVPQAQPQPGDGEPEPAKPEAANNGKSNGELRIEQIEAIVSELVGIISQTKLSPDKSYKRKQVEAALRQQHITFRGKDVANARENNVGPRSRMGATFDWKDVASILAYSDPRIQPYFKQHKKEIESIISNKIKELAEPQEAH